MAKRLRADVLYGTLSTSAAKIATDLANDASWLQPAVHAGMRKAAITNSTAPGLSTDAFVHNKGTTTIGLPSSYVGRRVYRVRRRQRLRGLSAPRDVDMSLSGKQYLAFVRAKALHKILMSMARFRPACERHN